MTDATPVGVARVALSDLHLFAMRRSQVQSQKPKVEKSKSQKSFSSSRLDWSVGDSLAARARAARRRRGAQSPPSPPP